MEHEMVLDTTASDLDLQTAIEEALWSLDTIRVTKPDLAISVKNGQAVVRGIVSSRAIQQQAVEAVNDVPGLAEVTFELMNDDDLVYAAAYTLAMDPRTRAIRPGYSLVSHNGLVHLTGKLSPQEREAAEAVLQGVAGVRGVRVSA